MAETEQLIIQISAETVELVKSLSTAKNQLNEFGKDGEFSIQSLNKAIKALQSQYEKTTDPIQKANIVDSVVRLKTEVVRLKDRYKDLTNVQKDNAAATGQAAAAINRAAQTTSNLEDPARRARISLLAVNNVVRDLPFGFIAISNNLPILFDQFGLLVKESGGLKSAFKSLGQSLLGAGGVSIALSVIVSGVTSLVQKYGSLQAATVGLLGGFGNLENAIERVNKIIKKNNEEYRTNIELTGLAAASTQGEVSILKAYLGIAGDVSKSVDSQNEAKQRILDTNKEYFKDINAEKLGLATLTQLVGLYSKQLINNAKIKVFSEKIAQDSAALFEFENTTKDVVDRLASIGQATAAPITGFQKFILVSSALSRGLDANLISTLRLIEGTDALIRQRNDLEAQQDKTTISISQYQNAVDSAAEESIRLSQEIKGITDSLEKNDKGIKTNSNSVDDNKKRQEALAKELEKQNEQWERLQRNFAKLTFPLKLDEEIDKQFKNENPEPVKIPVRPYIQIDLIKEQLKQEQIDKALEATKKQTEALRQDVTSLFNQTLGPAIDGVFNALLSGENVLQRLGEVFKRLAVDIAATIVKALVLKAILSAINPKAGVFSSVKGGASGLANAIFSAFGAMSVAAPNGNVSPLSGPGGIALQGEVVFVQRGTDLVGVLNRGNARIGRVG